MSDLRIERLRLDLDGAAVDPERARELVRAISAHLAAASDRRHVGAASRDGGGATVKVHVEAPDGGHASTGVLARAVADALLGRLC